MWRSMWVGTQAPPHPRAPARDAPTHIHEGSFLAQCALTLTPIGCNDADEQNKLVIWWIVGADLSRPIDMKVRTDELMCSAVLSTEMQGGWRSRALLLTLIPMSHRLAQGSEPVC